MSSTVQEASRLDAADPLAGFRERFALPRGADGRPLTYLCGHSLGLAPLRARAQVEEVLDDWDQLAVLAHERARRPWIDFHEQLRAGLASLCGARPQEVVAMNSLTVNLHLMLASFYRPSGARTRIVIEAGAFPSDRYAVASQIAWHGLDPRRELIELAPGGDGLQQHAALEQLLDAERERIALVLWPGVQYLTGQAFALAPIARAAHRIGALVGFDLAHAIGNIPLELTASEGDFAVWCSYKYLNAGPGAIAGAFVHSRHHDRRDLPRLAGWWGNDLASRFEMRRELAPAAGVDAWQVSNPPILACAPLIASLELFGAAGMQRLREKSVALTGFLGRCIAPLPLTLLTPDAPDERGCQLSLRIHGGSARGRKALEHLADAGVMCDWREPDILRAAPVPLYNSFQDVERFATVLAGVLGKA